MLKKKNVIYVNNVINVNQKDTLIEVIGVIKNQ